MIVYLGTIGGTALSLTLLATVVTFALQWRHAPFREDALTYATAKRAEMRRRKRSKHAPWEGRTRRALRRVRNDCWEMPSLNGLQLTALTMHLVTLVCGLLCLASGDPDSAVAIAAGWVSLAAIGIFTGMVIRYVRPRCGTRHDKHLQMAEQATGIGSKSPLRSRSRRVQPMDATSTTPPMPPPTAKVPPPVPAATTALQVQQVQAGQLSSATEHEGLWQEKTQCKQQGIEGGRGGRARGAIADPAAATPVATPSFKKRRRQRPV